MIRSSYLYVMEDPDDPGDCDDYKLFTCALLDRFNCNPIHRSPQFTVCLPRLHFIPGRTVFENHQDAVDSSEMILCIISPWNSNWIKYCRESSFYTYVVKNKADHFLPVFLGYQSCSEANEACPLELQNRTKVIFSHPWDQDEDSWCRLAEALKLPLQPIPRDPVQCTEDVDPIITDEWLNLLSIDGLQSSENGSYMEKVEISGHPPSHQTGEARNTTTGNTPYNNRVTESPQAAIRTSDVSGTCVVQFERLSSQVTVDDGIGTANSLRSTESNTTPKWTEGDVSGTCVVQFERLSSQVTVDDGIGTANSPRSTEFNTTPIWTEENWKEQQKNNRPLYRNSEGEDEVNHPVTCGIMPREMLSGREKLRDCQLEDINSSDYRENHNWAILSSIGGFAVSVWDFLSHY